MDNSRFELLHIKERKIKSKIKSKSLILKIVNPNTTQVKNQVYPKSSLLNHQKIFK